MTLEQHRVQILEHITKQDWTSQKETNRDHVSLTVVVTTAFFDREKTLTNRNAWR